MNNLSATSASNTNPMVAEKALEELVTKGPKRTKRAYSFKGTHLMRYSASNCPIYLMRIDSHGEDGTRFNSKHHAPLVLPFANLIMAATEVVPFKKWVQGNNVHVIYSESGIEYRWRPMWRHLNAQDKSEGNRYYYGLKCLQVMPDGTQECKLELTDPKEMFLIAQRWQELLAH